MSAVVSDASPLNYLIIVGAVEMRPVLFGQIVIASGVGVTAASARAVGEKLSRLKNANYRAQADLLHEMRHEFQI